MAVIRRTLNPEARSWTTPLDRRVLIRSRVPARAAFGVLLLGYSTVATMLVVQDVAALALAVHGGEAMSVQ